MPQMSDDERFVLGLIKDAGVSGIQYVASNLKLVCNLSLLKNCNCLLHSWMTLWRQVQVEDNSIAKRTFVDILNILVEREEACRDNVMNSLTVNLFYIFLPMAKI